MLTTQFCQLGQVVLSVFLIYVTKNVIKCKTDCINRFLDPEYILLDTKIKILAQLFPKLL